MKLTEKFLYITQCDENWKPILVRYYEQVKGVGKRKRGKLDDTTGH